MGKEDWVNNVAAKGETARRNGQVRWGSMRRLQEAHSGHRPVQTAVVLKADGKVVKGPEEVIDHHLKNFRVFMMRMLLLLCLPCHHCFTLMILLPWRS